MPVKSVYIERQSQSCDNSAMTLAIENIENNGVTRKWVATPIWNDSIVFNEENYCQHHDTLSKGALIGASKVTLQRYSQNHRPRGCWPFHDFAWYYSILPPFHPWSLQWDWWLERVSEVVPTAGRTVDGGFVNSAVSGCFWFFAWCIPGRGECGAD